MTEDIKNCCRTTKRLTHSFYLSIETEKCKVNVFKIIIGENLPNKDQDTNPKILMKIIQVKCKEIHN